MGTRVITLPPSASAHHARHGWSIDTTKTIAMLWISGMVLMASLAIGSMPAFQDTQAASVSGAGPGFGVIATAPPGPGPAPSPAFR